MKAPYGLFPNPANYAVLGFALRKHKEDLFNPSTSQPVGDEKLNDMIETLLKFWNYGKNDQSNKLILRFGSVEERNLTSILGEVFNLGVVKGVSMSDLKSLTYAKWCITEFCKQVAKYPLWSLLYCEEMKTKPGCQKAIADMIALFNQDSYQLAKVKDLLKKIKNDQIDLYKMLTKASNYREGFVNFINSIKDVELKAEWWDELEEELSHLQSEIAFRREEDVKNCVMSFYINKIKPQNEASVTIASENHQGASSASSPSTEDDIKKAKSLVKESTITPLMWKSFVLEIIEEYPQTAKFISEYLGITKNE